ncbi:hypothetical protein [Winogradskyella sp.]
MKKLEITNGKWYPKKLNSNLIEIECSTTLYSKGICQLSNYNMPEMRRNAKLIANAPEIYNALIEMCEGYKKLWDKLTKHACITPEYRNATILLEALAKEEKASTP